MGMSSLDYHGSPDPEAAIIKDGSSSESCDATKPKNETTHKNKSSSNDEKTEESQSRNRRLPISRSNSNLPLTHPPSSTENTGNDKTGNSSAAPIRLLHSSLLRVPLQLRFAFYGFLSSVFFMMAYNMAVESFEDRFAPSTIYAAVYLVFIPVAHLMISVLVFGWPERYFASLMSNVPIGLTAIALGSFLTAYLDRVQFNEYAESLVRNLGFTPHKTADEAKSEFYSSMFVLVVTSFWNFILSVLVNSPTEASEKKQL